MSETDDLYGFEDNIAAIPISGPGRIVYRVTFYVDHWVVRRAGEFIGCPRTKLAAVLLGRKLARLEWKQGRLSQLVVHGKNGRIQFEWTYGADPERSKG